MEACDFVTDRVVSDKVKDKERDRCTELTFRPGGHTYLVLFDTDEQKSEFDTTLSYSVQIAKKHITWEHVGWLILAILTLRIRAGKGNSCSISSTEIMKIVPVPTVMLPIQIGSSYTWDVWSACLVLLCTDWSWLIPSTLPMSSRYY